jgi:hypothetical protein
LEERTKDPTRKRENLHVGLGGRMKRSERETESVEPYKRVQAKNEYGQEWV